MSQRIAFVLAALIVSSGELAAQGTAVAENEVLVQRPTLEASAKTLSVSFPEETSLQEVFQQICEQADVTVLFDESFRDTTTLVNLGTVSVQDALEKLTMIHRLFYKIIDPTTIVIIPDNAQKHRQYDDMLLHTFYVKHGNVNGIANMFRTLAGIQRVQPEAGQKSVTVRATADQLLVAQSVLERNDAAPAELAVQVELLAVDPEPDLARGLTLTADEYLRFRAETGAEVLGSQSIRLTENERASLSIEEGALRSVTESSPSQEVSTDQPGTPVPRRLGIDLSLHPRASMEGGILLGIVLRANVLVGNEAAVENLRSPVRSREVTTTVSLDSGETSLLSGMARLDELGGALASTRTDGPRRNVVLAIRGDTLRPAARPKMRSPLPMGTEQQIRVPPPVMLR